MTTPLRARTTTRRTVPSPSRRLRVVEAPSARAGASPALRRGTFVGIVVFVALLALAASHALLVQGQIELDALELQVAEQQESYHRARLEVATLEAPERIVEEARARLGMVRPADVVYLTPAEATDDDGVPELVDDTWLAIKPHLERSS